MIPFDEALADTFRRLGLGEPGVMLELASEWADLAGEPWASKARPLYLKSGVLVVEATAPGAVGFLKYGVGELERRLAERFGREEVRSVEIKAPSRGSQSAR